MLPTSHQQYTILFSIFQGIYRVQTGKQASSWTNRINDAKRMINKGRYIEAIHLLEELNGEQPDEIEPIYLLSMALFNTDQPTKALETISEAVSLSPENADILALLGQIQGKLGYHEQAISTFEKSLSLDDRQLHALNGLGSLLFNHRLDHEKAISHFEKALQVKPSYAPARINLAMTLSNKGQTEEALKHGYMALKHAPKNGFYYMKLGDLQQQMGNKIEARQLLEKAIKLDPTSGEAYLLLSRSKKFTFEDKKLIRNMEKALEAPMPPRSRSRVHFALGKIYDDLENWSQAFSHYRKGNQLVHATYDRSAHIKNNKVLRKVFNKPYFQRYSAAGHASKTPIFIVGMPRSGSTLIDQILSSHPQVHSVGEFMELWPLVEKLCEDSEKEGNFPTCMKHIESEGIYSLAEKYLSLITENLERDISRVVNKQPNNFSLLGIIAIAFPNAKIINTRRNPLDTCLSCYFQPFEFIEYISWAFDLDDIASFYRLYHQTMEHWRKNLPLPILDVDYEDVVEDPEGMARKILDFCELEWDPTVTEFYKHKRSVQTASVMQVRQPIYKKSMARWKHYARDLQPLVDTLGELLDNDKLELEAAGLKFKKTHRFSIKKLLS